MMMTMITLCTISGDNNDDDDDNIMYHIWWHSRGNRALTRFHHDADVDDSCKCRCHADMRQWRHDSLCSLRFADVDELLASRDTTHRHTLGPNVSQPSHTYTHTSLVGSSGPSSVCVVHMWDPTQIWRPNRHKRPCRDSNLLCVLFSDILWSDNELYLHTRRSVLICHHLLAATNWFRWHSMVPTDGGLPWRSGWAYGLWGSCRFCFLGI